MNLTTGERYCLIPVMDDECLADELEKCLKNVTSIARVIPPVTYEENLINALIPEVIKRLK